MADRILPQTIKRIQKELFQLKNDPIDGVSIVQQNLNNVLAYIVNIRIQQGPYVGAIAHCKLELSPKHPQVAPFMQIFNGGGFEQCGHHHILAGDEKFMRFCIDLLSDSVLNSSEVGSGWNPAYTLKTLLIQIQLFISDPDLNGHELSEEILKKFRKSNFSQRNELESQGSSMIHSYLNPYPSFPKDNLPIKDNLILQEAKAQGKWIDESESEEQFMTPRGSIIELLQPTKNNESQLIDEQYFDCFSNFSDLENSEKLNPKEEKVPNLIEAEDSSILNNQISFLNIDDIAIDKKQSDLKQILEEGIVNEDFIKQQLTCYINLTNPIDDPEEVFGLPIYLEIDEKGKLQSSALPDTLSQSAFEDLLKQNNLSKPQIQNCLIKSKLKKGKTFKSSTSSSFNCWLPYYLNQEYFEKNVKIIEKYITYMSSFGELGFKPFMVLEVIPNLINKMFVQIFDAQNGRVSNVAIQQYIQLFQLLIEFCKKYPQLQDSLDKKIIDFISSDFNRNKKVIGDFGEFFILLSASSISLNHFEFLDILYREQSARQMLFLENNEEFMINYSASFSQPDSEEVFLQRMMSVWEHNKIGHNLLVFTIEASKYLTNRLFLKRIARESFSLISEAFAGHFVSYTRKVRSLIKNHKDFLQYLGLGNKYDTFEKVHEVFLIGIYVSNLQGYTRKRAELDDEKNNCKPNLKHFSIECKQLKQLKKKSDVEIQELKMIGDLDFLKLEDVMLKGLLEGQDEFLNVEDNNLLKKEREQIKSVFKAKSIMLNKYTDSQLIQINEKLKQPNHNIKGLIFSQKMQKNLNHAIQSASISRSHLLEQNSQVPKLNHIPKLTKEEQQKAQSFYNYSKEEKIAPTGWRKKEDPKEVSQIIEIKK